MLALTPGTRLEFWCIRRHFTLTKNTQRISRAGHIVHCQICYQIQFHFRLQGHVFRLSPAFYDAIYAVEKRKYLPWQIACNARHFIAPFPVPPVYFHLYSLPKPYTSLPPSFPRSRFCSKVLPTQLPRRKMFVRGSHSFLCLAKFQSSFPIFLSYLSLSKVNRRDSYNWGRHHDHEWCLLYLSADGFSPLRSYNFN